MKTEKDDKAGAQATDQTTGAKDTTTGMQEQGTGPKVGTDLMVVDYGEDAGVGLQNVTADEMSMPFIRILQSNSPQVDKSKNSPKYMPGVIAGSLLKTSTQEVFDGEKGMEFVPVHRDRNFVEYVPHDKGRGFVGIHQPNDPEILRLLKEQGKFKKLVNAAGNEISDTFYIFGLFMPTPGYIFPAALGLASTQIPRFKQFMDIQTAIKYPNGKGGFVQPPMWAHKWTLKVVPDQNKKGSFFSFKMALANDASPMKPLAARIERDSDLYKAGKELYEQIAAGRATVRHEDVAEADGGKSGDMDDDIPF